MTTTSIPDATMLAVLLCSQIGMPKQAAERGSTLSGRDLSGLLSRVESLGWEPGDLLRRRVGEVLAALKLDEGVASRAEFLLSRGGQVGVELERLTSLGIWILDRSSAQYPPKLRERLGEQAPPVIFGAGPVETLATSGMAIVGSRNVDDAAIDFAVSLSERCAESGLTVFSGAARGVDRRSMGAAIEASGMAVGVVADDLEKLIREQEIRRYVLHSELTLITPYRPSTGFSVGNAMGRNKLIYCLADYAVVVASALKSGGTWAGAVEALGGGWVPVFVRQGSDTPAGNSGLLDYRPRSGQRAIELDGLPRGDLLDFLETKLREIHPVAGPEQQQLRLGIS